MTDYIPNDPDCPKCGGGGMRGTLPVFSTWHDCHCQHPKIVTAVWALELAGDLVAAGEAEYGADYGAAK